MPWNRWNPKQIPQSNGKPLITAIVTLVNQCWRAKYHLKSFWQACTITLWKPDKDDYSEPGAWRPIALLNMLCNQTVLEIGMEMGGSLSSHRRRRKEYNGLLGMVATMILLKSTSSSFLGYLLFN